MESFQNTIPKLSFWNTAFLFLYLIFASSESYSNPTQQHNIINKDTPIIWRPALKSWLIKDDIFYNTNKFEEQILKSEPQNITLSKNLPSHGFSKGVLISKLNIQASINSSKSDYIIYINYPLLDHIKLFNLNSRGHLVQLYHTGDSFSLSSKPIPHRAFAFPITLKAGKTSTYYLAAKSQDTLDTPISIFTNSEFVKHTQKEQYILGAYFGGVIIMALFMLTLYINFKDKTLIIMSVYLFCLAGVVGSVTGVTSQALITDSPELAKNIRIVFLAISMTCTMLFE